MNKKDLKYITDGIGKCMEQDNKIICYISDYSFKKYRKRKRLDSYYLLDLKGIDDKEVIYFFDNVNFSSFLSLDVTSSINKCSYVFKNCVFRRNINIYNTGKITFEDNKYLPSNNTKVTDFRISSSNTDEIKFINDMCYVVNKFDSDVTLNLSSDNIEFVNTNVYGNTIMILNSNNLELDNSGLHADEVIITANNINNNNNGNSEIVANDVLINNKNNNYDFILDIYADSIIFNDVEVDVNCNNIILNDSDFKLQKERVNLLYKLRDTLNNCNSDAKKEIDEYSNKIYTSSIKKVLKR